MKTLVMINDAIVGITEEDVKIGDVLSIEENGPPFIVFNILSKRKKITLEDDISEIEWEEDKLDYEQVAYLAIDEKKTTKYVKKTSQELEKRMAKTLGGRTTPGSGAFSGHKGDVSSKEWLGEHKYTNTKNYRLKRVIWEKIAREAFEKNKTPVFEVILDQDASHLRMIYMNFVHFQEKIHATEDELCKIFHFTQIHAKNNKESINLELNTLQTAINNTLSLDIFKVPAIFLTFDEQLTLIGLLSKDFEVLFKPETEESKPSKKKTAISKKKISKPMPKAPKTVWPKKPFPQRKKQQ